MKNNQEWFEVVADQAREILRLRKKCSAYDRDVKRLEGVVVDYERDCKRLHETIVSLGGAV